MNDTAIGAVSLWVEILLVIIVIMVGADIAKASEQLGRAQQREIASMERMRAYLEFAAYDDRLVTAHEVLSAVNHFKQSGTDVALLDGNANVHTMFDENTPADRYIIDNMIGSTPDKVDLRYMYRGHLIYGLKETGKNFIDGYTVRMSSSGKWLPESISPLGSSDKATYREIGVVGVAFEKAIAAEGEFPPASGIVPGKLIERDVNEQYTGNDAIFN